MNGLPNPNEISPGNGRPIYQQALLAISLL